MTLVRIASCCIPFLSTTLYSQQLIWPSGFIISRYEALCSSRASVIVGVARCCETLQNRCEHRIIYEIHLIYTQL